MELDCKIQFPVYFNESFFQEHLFFFVGSLLSFELSVQHFSFESLLFFVKLCITAFFGGKSLEQASLLMKIGGQKF
jgi:hypothetical protein